MTDRAAGREASLRIEAISSALNIGGAQHHLFLCAEPTTARCASREESAAVWRHLKRRLTEAGLSSAPPPWRGTSDGPPPATGSGTGPVLRTKVDCLRICEQGPIAVVYPDGVWYRSVSIEVIDRIVDEHLIGGKPVAEHVFAGSRRGQP